MLPIKARHKDTFSWRVCEDQLLGHSRLVAAAILVLGLTFFLIQGEAYAVGSPKSRSPGRSYSFETNSLLGAYLAGRVARTTRDSDAAAFYYRRALLKDPANQELLDDAFQLELAAGAFEEARSLAQRLVRKQGDNTFSQIFLGLDAYKRKDYAIADEHFRQAEISASPDEPTLKLCRAWVAVAQNHAEKAIAALEAPSKVAWAAHFETVQRAFIADLARKKSAAEEAYLKVLDRPNARISEAYARHLSFWGERSRALEVLNESGADETPLGKAAKDELLAGRSPRLMVTNQDEGLSETFLGIGQVLASNNGVDAAQIYLRLALFLNPNSNIAKLELAEIYGALLQYEKAIKVLDTIPDGSPFVINAQTRKAVFLNAIEKPDQAVALLKGLLEKNPNDDQILQTLASLESTRKRFDAAIPYYARSIAMLKKPERKQWQLYYSRGIAYERSKQWEKAEPDFKKALELDPDQGAVLNYLGYSWLDRDMNIPEAFNMIKKAVKLRPNDGYIIDSLGWAYYLQKDYTEAVKHLDKAVELRPEDPTLNDHLGDVYWRLGRRLEAKFQWTQALSLSPEPDEAEKIKKKLDIGLTDGPEQRADATVPPEHPQAGVDDLSRPATSSTPQ